MRRNVLFLRKLINRHMLVGRILHTEISRLIDEMLVGSPAPLEAAIHRAWKYLEHCLQFSREQRYLFQRDNHPYFTVLFEDVYNIRLEDAAVRHLYRKIKKALWHFYRSTLFQDLRHLAPGDLLSKENLVQLPAGAAEVWLKLDLLYRENRQRLVVIDWKLSDFQREKHLLQLSVYGHLVCNLYHVPPAQVRLINFHLNRGEGMELPYDSELDALSRGYLEKSVKKLQDFHSRVEKGLTLNGIPVQFQKERCQYCPFRKLCFPDYEKTLRGVNKLNALTCN